MSDLLHTFTSHVAGKNATVEIYGDRIEWRKQGSVMGRATAATVTMGLSLLGGRKEQSEMIPMRAVTNVSTKRDGLVNSKVVVASAGGTVEFRVSHKEAATVKDVIMRSVLA